MSSTKNSQEPSVESISGSPWRFSPAAHPALRVGLLLDGPHLSAFFARVIQDIRASNFANLELLVFRKRPGRSEAQPRRSPLNKIARKLLDREARRHALYDLYLRLDQRMKPSNHPLDQVDCSQLLVGIEAIEVEPIGKKFIHRFPEDALEKIRAKNLDVLLRFGFNILHGEILYVARYGVWSYHHGDNEFYRGGPSHFWELHEGAELSGVILQVLTEELDGGTVLCKSLFSTERTISVSRNRFAPYWGSTEFVIRKLHELHRFGWDYVQERALPRVAYKGKRKIYRNPGNSDLVRWLGPIFLKKALQYPFRKKTIQHWRIAIRQSCKPIFDSADGDLSGFRWIEPQKGHFWADPFLLEHERKTYIFFEDFSYSDRRGRISIAELSPKGDLISPTTCLESVDHHYSYPHVFRVDNDLFMVPEAFDSSSIDLYRCVQFPNHWEREATLLTGKFVDTTIWQYGGLWWLMTTKAEPDARAGTLLLFYSDSLKGRWNFHPANPISTDIRNNRGAGRVFEAGNRLIRPSQNCSPDYGYSFALNEILDLSETRYREKTLTVVTPESWAGLSGVHTYNWIKNIEVIDGRTKAHLKDHVPDEETS